MTVPPLTGPVSARTFLFGEGEHSDVLARMIRDHGDADTTLDGVRHLSRSAADAVRKEVASVAGDLLELDLGDMLVRAWRKYAALLDAADRTRTVPGSEEIVVLATHRVTAVHEPYVALLVNGLQINTFDFRLKAVFDLTGVTVVVRGGALIAVRGGEALVTMTLSMEGGQLVERQRRAHVDRVVTLTRPLPLRGGLSTGQTPAGDAAQPGAA